MRGIFGKVPNKVFQEGRREPPGFFIALFGADAPLKRRSVK